jgi:hypothetical protein
MTIRTELVSDQRLVGWEEYANLLLLAAIGRAKDAPAETPRHFDAAVAMWDGHGFRDRATRQNELYATHKLALALLATQRLSAVTDAARGARPAGSAPIARWRMDHGLHGEGATPWPGKRGDHLPGAAGAGR